LCYKPNYRIEINSITYYSGQIQCQEKISVGDSNNSLSVYLYHIKSQCDYETNCVPDIYKYRFSNDNCYDANSALVEYTCIRYLSNDNKSISFFTIIKYSFNISYFLKLRYFTPTDYVIIKVSQSNVFLNII
jgi:hypothetical protein